MPPVQVIDDAQHFTSDLVSYIDASTGGDAVVGSNYHVVLVFGLQSSGKLTLLNTLFKTRFAVMDETRRQQTTHGIWMGAAEAVASRTDGYAPNLLHILVMDVEGSDGRERGEDQDFERKAALFALATLEILIVNIWENQVGLYQGANMGLLKTVFEVNLLLIALALLPPHKTMLLFVVRDFVGNTPLDNLATTLVTELHKMWGQLAKPSGTEHLLLDDLFDVEFHGLGHRVLQPEVFTQGVQDLGDRLQPAEGTAGLFKPEYHQQLPVDGWALYAERCWAQIVLNQELDLPTQQVLVARFKCEELATKAYGEFETAFGEHFPTGLFEDDGAVPAEAAAGLVAQFHRLLGTAVALYDALAQRYHKDPYQAKRLELETRIASALAPVHTAFLSHLKQVLLKEFAEAYARRTRDELFVTAVERAQSSAVSLYVALAKVVSMEGVFPGDVATADFKAAVAALVETERTKEEDAVVARCGKRVASRLKLQVPELLSRPDATVWDRVMEAFSQAETDAVERYQTDAGPDFGVGGGDEAIAAKIHVHAWGVLLRVIHDTLTEDNVVRMMRDRFEDKFRYDDEEVPRVWTKVDEVEASFRVAREHGLAMLPLLSLAATSAGVEIMPESGVDEDSEGEAPPFAHILSDLQQAAVKARFRRQADAAYTDARRLVMLLVTQIPYYIYLVIAVLGWNELMMVLRNPFLVMWGITLLAVAYGVRMTGMEGAVLTVVQGTFHLAVTAGKQKLREVLEVDAVPVHAKPVEQDPDAIELEEM